MNTVETADRGTIAESAASSRNAVNSSGEAESEYQDNSLLLTFVPQNLVAACVKRVSWGLTVNTGNYSSARLDATADVPMGYTAESTLKALQEWVRSQSPLSEDERDRGREDRAREFAKLRELQEARERAEYELAKVKKVFATLGMEIPEKLTEDLPF